MGILISAEKKMSAWAILKRDKLLYILIAPSILVVFFVSYLPLPGLVISFMDYDPFLKFKSPWVGFKNYIDMVQMPMFTTSIWNTFKTSGLIMVIQFFVTVSFALLLNELKNGFFKKLSQTVSSLPFFLSWISVIGMTVSLYSPYGPINDLIVFLSGGKAERTLFLAEQSLFLPNVILLSLWKNVGYASILYLATLTSIDPQLYEAAYMDGAGRFKQMVHITLPGLMPTAVMVMILAVGSLADDNFQLIYGLQNPFIDYEVIGTVVFKQGIQQGQYSITTALGLAQGFVSFSLILIANKLAKKFAEISLF